MKIVFICDVLGKENNGTTVAAMNLIRHLRAHGHTVTVVCPDADKQGLADYVIVPTVNFGILNRYVASNGVTIAHAPRTLLRDVIGDADVVHLLVPFLMSMKAVLLAREMNIPVTASFHCQAENFSSHLFLMNAKRFNRGVYRYFWRHVYRYCDAIHYPTQFICDVFEEAIGTPTNRHIISNGVNRRFMRRPTDKPDAFSDRFVILFTGRYSREKSQHVLIEAVARSKYASRIQLIFAGCGPTEQKLRTLSKHRLQNPPLFRFFSRDEMLDVLNYADLYVHPAEIEIEAISCLEAITCGLVPVIADSPRSATKSFALAEDNLFRAGDPTSLAERIDYWIEHPQEREVRQREYLGYAARFDQDACMQEMEQMLLEIVARHNEQKEAADFVSA